MTNQQTNQQTDQLRTPTLPSTDVENCNVVKRLDSTSKFRNKSCGVLKKISRKWLGTLAQIMVVTYKWCLHGVGLKTNLEKHYVHYVHHSKRHFCYFWMIEDEWYTSHIVHRFNFVEIVQSKYAIWSRSNAPNSRKWPKTAKNLIFGYLDHSKWHFWWILNDPAWAIWEPTCQDHLVQS